MSIRNLDSLLDPASVAVFGASLRAGSVGATVWRNLNPSPVSTGGSGTRFTGPVYAVNPKHRELNGVRSHARAADLPSVPDLAVICTPPHTVPGLIAELAALGTRAAVVVTAGLTTPQKQAMLDAARPSLLRLLGPNCIGHLAPHRGLNASFAHTDALPGELAFVSQSGALVTAMLDWARSRGIGFSHFVSLGEHADVDFGDMLDYLASDGRTRAILLYIESVESPRKFMSAARAAARNKPVIVVKAGRSRQGEKAAASHTGALAGSDLVFDAAIRRAGMLRVDTLQQLFLAAETLSRFRSNLSERLTILTNGGGAGVMAADAAEYAGVELAELSPSTLKRLDTLLPPNWSHGNPVDIIGDAPVERYVQALQVLKDDPSTGAVLLIHAPTAIVPSAEIALALAPVAAPSGGEAPRVMGCWLGDAAVAQARQTFQDAGIAGYATPEEAVRAFAMLVTYRRNQAQLLETPPAAVALGAAENGASTKAGVNRRGVIPGPAADGPQAREAARSMMARVLASGREMLTEPEAKAVLQAYGIPVVATRSVCFDEAMAAGSAPRQPGLPGKAANPPRTAAVGAASEALIERAAAEARAIGFPVALKILSVDISHKSDVGGVALNLNSTAEVRASARAMLARVAQMRPAARIDGFTVQAMAHRPHAQELIVGASIDKVFGPVILFGQGGTAVEVLADRAVALPPLNVTLARALVARTRVARLLKGWRDVPPANEPALHAVLVAVSNLLADVPQLTELDINPLLLNPEGAVALDARMRISAQSPAGAAHFAISPYPSELTETVPWRGRTLTLRAIRPEDEAQHLAFLNRLDPEDVRLRVFYSRRSIEHSELARLTQIDYAREMAFVAVAAEGPAGAEQTLGVVRAMADPDNQDAEFGIIVRSDLKGSGLGDLLMKKMLRTLRARGTKRLVATVLGENSRMLQLAADLGFVEDLSQRSDGTRHISLVL